MLLGGNRKSFQHFQGRFQPLENDSLFRHGRARPSHPRLSCGAANASFKRKPAPDLIRGGNRFASRKRVESKIRAAALRAPSLIVCRRRRDKAIRIHLAFSRWSPLSRTGLLPIPFSRGIPSCQGTSFHSRSGFSAV